jgi:hypothetical protein
MSNTRSQRKKFRLSELNENVPIVT